MAGQGGCFKRQSPLANQAALVEAASARLGSSEPRVVPCAAQTSEQYRYVSSARPRPPPPPPPPPPAPPPPPQRPHKFPAPAAASASRCHRLLPLIPAPFPPPPPSFYLGAWEGRSDSGVSTFRGFVPSSPRFARGFLPGAHPGAAPRGSGPLKPDVGQLRRRRRRAPGRLRAPVAWVPGAWGRHREGGGQDSPRPGTIAAGSGQPVPAGGCGVSKLRCWGSAGHRAGPRIALLLLH